MSGSVLQDDPTHVGFCLVIIPTHVSVFPSQQFTGLADSFSYLVLSYVALLTSAIYPSQHFCVIPMPYYAAVADLILSLEFIPVLFGCEDLDFNIHIPENKFDLFEDFVPIEPI